MTKNNGGFLLGALVGGIAGAAAALFLTSDKGRKWLDDLNQPATWEPVKATALEWMETAKEKTKEIADFIPLKTAGNAEGGQRADGSVQEAAIPISAAGLKGGESADESGKAMTIPIPPSAGPADRETLQKLLEEAEAALDDAEQNMPYRKETE